jgi:hypothetical protein
MDFNALLAESNRGSSYNENKNENNLIRNLELSHNLFKADEYNRNDRFNNKTLKVTKPSLVMYNVTVNNDTPINIGALAQRIQLPLEKEEFPNGIVAKVTKITGLTGRFQTAFTITNTYNRTGSANASKIFGLDFAITLKLGGEIVKANLTLFKNGKIKLSGGYLSQDKENVNNDYYFEAQPELIREFIVNKYTDGQRFLRKDFTFNNVVGDFRVNKGFNLMQIQAASAKSNYNVTYNPELSRFLQLKSKGYSFLLGQNGLVQIQGLKEQDDLEKAYLVAIEFINDMHSIHEKVAGHPRLYKNRPVPDGRIKKQKVLNKNAPAPNVSRRGTSCPVGRRPDPYSMQGRCPKEGCYVKPNPQGQPCCYKIPKNTRYSERKVANAFNRANVRVPNRVRNVFNIGHNTNNKLNNTSHANAKNITVRVDPKSGLMIGTRQCKRYTKVALVDIARRLGITVNAAASKEKLCGLISNKATNVTNTNTAGGNRAYKFKMNADDYVVTGNSVNSLRIGRRYAKTYKREMLVKFMTRMHLRIPSAATIGELCRIVLEAKQAHAARSRTPSPRASPVAAAAPKQKDPMKHLRLTDKLIRKNIIKLYGQENVPMLNARVKNMKKNILASFNKNIGYGKVVMGSKGMPKRRSIRAIKRAMVNKFKNQNRPNSNSNSSPLRRYMAKMPKGVIQEEL